MLLPSSPPTFYFTHLIKLQTLPYVQKQINNFTRYFQDHLDIIHNPDRYLQIDDKWHYKTMNLYLMMEKKLRQIERFHYENWMDYRANLVLRAKRVLLEFCWENKQVLEWVVGVVGVGQGERGEKGESPDRGQEEEGRRIVEEQSNGEEEGEGECRGDQIIELQQDIKSFIIQQPDSKQPHQIAIKPNQTLSKRTKTQGNPNPPSPSQYLTTKQPKHNPTSSKKEKTKPLPSKQPTVSISKDDINKQVSMIIEKSRSRESFGNVNGSKGNGLVFASRRVKEKDGQEDKEIVVVGEQSSARRVQESLQRSLKRSIHNSKEKPTSSTHRQQKQHQRTQLLHSSRQKQHTASQHNSKPTSKLPTSKPSTSSKPHQKHQKNSTKPNKNMTKEEFIQHLVTKNKMNISGVKF